MAKKARSSEVDAYIFIKEELRVLGWDTRNPERHPSGQVYTQSEALANLELKAHLGLDKPENVIKVTESVLCVIEAKRDRNQLDQALTEAIGYANKINAGRNLKARFVTGVAGNDVDGYLVATRYLTASGFQPITINGKPLSSLLSPTVAQTVLSGGPEIKDVPVDEILFLSKAENINEYLHLGAINKNQRASIIAALLLSFIEDTPPNVNAAPSILIHEINARASRVLSMQRKAEFYKYIEIKLPSTEEYLLRKGGSGRN